MKNPQIILTKKDKQDVTIIGMGQTMHRASLSEPRRQTVNKFNYRKKDITLGIELKIPFDECTMDSCNPIQ